jgi:hypothetical protein
LRKTLAGQESDLIGCDVSGEKDHTVPRAISNAAYEKQQRNPGVIEFVALRLTDPRKPQ